MTGAEHSDARSPRRSRRALLTGLALFLASIAATSVIVWRLTAGLAATADGFLRAAISDDMAAAKTLMSADFSDVSEDRMRKVLTDFGFTQYESASWTNRSIDGSVGTLAGTMKKRNGAEFPVTFNMVKERGEWRIASFQLPLSQLPPGYRERTPADRAEYCARTGKC